MSSKRRRRSRQAGIEFRPCGRGGARPGAGRPRTRHSRVPHRDRGGVPGDCPVLVTLRVLEVRRAVAYVLLNARKLFRQRRRRVPPVVLDEASSGLWFDGWKGRAPPPGRYADARREREVAAPRTWLLSKGWRRIGLIDPAEVPGAARGRMPAPA